MDSDSNSSSVEYYINVILPLLDEFEKVATDQGPLLFIRLKSIISKIVKSGAVLKTINNLNNSPKCLRVLNEDGEYVFIRTHGIMKRILFTGVSMELMVNFVWRDAINMCSESYIRELYRTLPKM